MVGCIFRGRLEQTSLKLRADNMLKAFHQGIDILARNPRILTWSVFFLPLHGCSA
jgi:hypothetical protein